jgi:hypothetical protein
MRLPAPSRSLWREGSLRAGECRPERAIGAYFCLASAGVDPTPCARQTYAKRRAVGHEDLEDLHDVSELIERVLPTREVPRSVGYSVELVETARQIQLIRRVKPAWEVPVAKQERFATLGPHASPEILRGGSALEFLDESLEIGDQLEAGYAGTSPALASIHEIARYRGEKATDDDSDEPKDSTRHAQESIDSYTASVSVSEPLPGPKGSIARQQPRLVDHPSRRRALSGWEAKPHFVRVAQRPIEPFPASERIAHASHLARGGQPFVQLWSALCPRMGDATQRIA